MAMLDTSRLSEGGGGKVNSVSKAQTSGAVSAQFKPYVMPAADKTTAFVGPTLPKTSGANNAPLYRPATATTVANTTPKVTNQAVNSPGPSNLPSKQLPTQTKLDTTSTPTIKLANSANTTATTTQPSTGISGTIEHKLTPEERKVRSKEFKSYLGELTGGPAVKRLATGNSPRVGDSFLPGWAAKTVGVGLDMLSAAPVVGAAGKTVAAASKIAPEIALASTILSTGGSVAADIKPLTSISQASKAGSATVKNVEKAFTPKSTAGAVTKTENVAPVKGISKTKTDSASQAAASAAAQSTAAGVRTAASPTINTNATTNTTTNNTNAPGFNSSAQFKYNEGVNSGTNATSRTTTDANEATNTGTNTGTDTGTNTGTIIGTDASQNTNFNDVQEQVQQQVQQQQQVQNVNQGVESGGGGVTKEPTGKTSPKVKPKVFIKPSDGKEKEDMRRKRRWVPSAVV